VSGHEWCVGLAVVGGLGAGGLAAGWIAYVRGRNDGFQEGWAQSHDMWRGLGVDVDGRLTILDALRGLVYCADCVDNPEHNVCETHLAPARAALRNCEPRATPAAATTEAAPEPTSSLPQTTPTGDDR
jgi:hypothetical protein